MAALSASIWIAVSLSLAIPPQQVDEAGPARRRLPPVDLGDPAELVPAATTAVLAAQRLAASGRKAEAAAAYEALWRETGDVKLLYQAGVARAQAGQYALAVRHFEAARGQAVGLGVDTQGYIEMRMASARAQTVGVRIAAFEGVGAARRAIPAELLARATIRLEPVSSSVVADPGAVIVLSNYQGEEVAVDRTPVVVHLAVPGFLPVSLLRSAGAAAQTWDIGLARQQVAVDLYFAPAKAMRRAHLRISSTDDSSLPAVDQNLESPSMRVMLTAGNWQLDVVAKRHEAHTSMVVGPGMRPVSVDLQKIRGGGSGTEFQRNDVLAAALGAGFVASELVGLGLVIAGVAKESRAHNKNDDLSRDALLATAGGEATTSGLAMLEKNYATADLHRDIRRANNLSTAGGVVAMAGLGSLLAAATVGTRVKRNAAYLEIGVGAAFAAGGAAWMAYATRRQADLLAPTEPGQRVAWSDLRGVNNHRIGATLVLGAGIGLVVFPAIALLADVAKARRMRRRGLSAAPVLGRDHVGLTIRGQF